MQRGNGVDSVGLELPDRGCNLVRNTTDRRLPHRDPARLKPRDDALEKRNIAKDRPEVKEEFRAAIDEFMAQPAPGWSAVEVELDEMKRNQLRALGYVLPASERRKREREEGDEEEAGSTEGGDDSADGSKAPTE